MLMPDRLLQYLVAAVNADRVAWDIGRGKERKPHDVVPMQVRHEDVVTGLAARSVPGEQMIAELAHPGAQIAQHVFVTTGCDFHTAGVAAVGAADRKRQFAIDKVLNRCRIRQAASAGSEQGIADFCPHRGLPKRSRQLASSTPKMHPERPA